MHSYRIEQLFILIGISIIVLGFWIYLIFNFKKKHLFYLSVVSALITLPFILFQINSNKILETNKNCVDEPIILEIYYGKKKPILILQDDFSYTIYFKKEKIKEGKWDAYGDKCKTIMLDKSNRLGFGEFKLETSLENNERQRIINSHLSK